ncbi:MAG TPA: M48 family metalloprotease [Candidatus Limnocylindrales bacterium]|nr:M48 family metalloprotease [Candidatus Limnocylindrales bacterium]
MRTIRLLSMTYVLMAFYLMANASDIEKKIESLDAEQRYAHAIQIYANIISANEIVDAPELHRDAGPVVNAYTMELGDGAVILTDGILKYVHNDDEIAFIISHELGHWAHRGRETAYSQEYWADAFGAKAMEIAGYNRCLGAQVMWRLGSPDSYTHPPSDKRWLAITLGCYGEANRIEEPIVPDVGQIGIEIHGRK